MADFVEKLILDDSGFINPLEKSLKKINETSEAFEDLNKDVKEQQGEMGKQIVDTNKKVNKAQDDTIKKTREQKEEFSKAASSFKIFGISLNDVKEKLTGYYNTLKGGLASLSEFGKLSMTQKRGVVELSQTLGGGRGAFIALAKGVNIFKAALISTGVGALIVALGSLITFLTNTQKGIDFVNRVSAATSIIFAKVADYAGYLGEKIFDAFENPKQAIKDFGKLLLDNVVNRFAGIIISASALGKAIVNIFNPKELKEAVNEFTTGLIQIGTGMDSAQQEAAKDGFKNFAKDVSNAVSETLKLEKALQDLEKEKIKFIKTESEVQVALEKNRNISKDTARSYTERTKAAQAANAIEADLTKQRLEFAQREYDIIKAQNALAENKNKDYEKEYQAAARVNGIKVESYRMTIRMQETLNGLLKEQEAYLVTSTDALRKMGVEWGTITELQDFEFAKQKQIGDLETMRAKIVDIGTSLKTDMTENLMIIDMLIKKISQSKLAPKFEFFDDAENDLFNINQLIEGAEKITAIRLRNAEKEIKNVEEKEKRKKIITLEGEAERLRILIEYGDKTTAEYERQLLRLSEIENELVIPEPDTEPFWKGINTFEDLLNKSLDRIFGPDNSQKAKEFLKGATALVSEFGRISAEATQIAIAQIDKQLDSLSKRRDKLESDLDYELQLQSEGRANNVGDKQKEVDALIAEEDRLNKQREELQKKAALQQLRAETAQQTASLITSSINIIKGFSNIPIVGLPLGITAAAALFGFFAKTKADAFKATRLHTGAERVSDHFGFTDKYGDTDIPGRGDGYRVVSSKTGRDTGVIISGREMIVPEKYSLENEAFFTNLRMGKYNGIDLDSAVRFSQTFKEVNNSSTTKVIEKAVIQPQKAVKQRVLLQVGPKKYTVVTIDDHMKDGQIINIDI